jgi:hypothetical protein
MSLQNNQTNEFIWHARRIAEFLGISERATFHKLEQNCVPGAKKVAGTWCLNVPVFRKSFEQGEPHE